MKSNSQVTDLINSLLMLVSALVAWKLPFHLFLFSYAVLGPLHYLTEIFWLREKNYFLPVKKNYLWIILPAILVSVLIWLNELDEVKNWSIFKQYGNSFISALFFCGFAVAVSLTLFSKTVYRVAIIAASIALSFLLAKQGVYLFIFGVLFATLIHVSLFTFLFVLQGAIKTKNNAAYFSLVVYLVCVISLFTLPFYSKQYTFSKDLYENFIKSSFQYVNYSIATFFHATENGPYNLLSENALRIQSFIAFSYTYHYLNWFSKVNIIKWHKVSGNSWKIITLLWLASIALYRYDYKVGFMALILLSLLHVFLEFPLNVLTFKSILSKKGRV